MVLSAAVLTALLTVPHEDSAAAAEAARRNRKWSVISLARLVWMREGQGTFAGAAGVGGRRDDAFLLTMRWR